MTEVWKTQHPEASVVMSATLLRSDEIGRVPCGMAVDTFEQNLSTAPASAAQLVVGLIPGQGTYLGWGFDAQSGHIRKLESGGTITTEEQIVLVLKAKVECELNITAQLQEGGVALRRCNPNGTWDFIHSLNKTWSNYSDCLRFLRPDTSPGKQEFFERLYVMYTVGYSISFGSLAVAILIIGYFRRLHCTRNYIHLHLFASFMLRAASIFVKDRVVHAHIGVKELQSLMMQDDLQNFIDAPSMDKSQYGSPQYLLQAGLWHEQLWLMQAEHRALFWSWPYRASFEGADVLSEEQGEQQAGQHGLEVVMVKLVDALNFILFLNTVRVLATKIWETNAVGHDTRKQYRKLAKSTLVLVLVFGVHYIVFVCLPHSFSGLGWEIRMHCELFLNSFQGFFVSIIYCYCNGEVQSEVKKMWSRWHLSIDWKRTPPCGGHRYGSVLTTMTPSTSSHSQMAASTRMVLLSGKATKTAGQQPDSHVTLPGYVRSNSEQDCQQHLIHEETKEGVERLGPVPVAGAGSECEWQLQHWQRVQEEAAGPDLPLGAGGGGEALRGDWCQQLPLAPTDGAERLGPVLGASTGCEQRLWCWQRVQMGLTPAAGASAGRDCGSEREQRIFSNHQRLALMTVTCAPPWSGAPAYLLHHPTVADTHHVPCTPPGGQHLS
ncbi:Parathyroid hormone 2 receptor [Myotis davidii]|uniref:Parathyroid hormone 2 receptor n=1 Tax=Myotis davidii TaxID=225400 RepID=L5M771_MYODS|nr:Parathyroid hormone 2 receptor [Myotis davidii]